MDEKKKRTVSVHLIADIGRFVAAMQKAKRRDGEGK